MILVVGMNPSSAKVTKGSAWYKLHAWMDQLGIDRWAFTNLSDDPKWDRKLGEEFIYTLRRSCRGHDKVLALGNLSSEALSLIDVRHFKMPHPSGLNRKLNNPEFVKEMLNECRTYLNGPTQ